MIFAHSIISGYICMQGSFIFHISLLVAMLIFVRVPPAEDLAQAFPGEESWARWWYELNAALHGILAVIHILTITDALDSVPAFVMSTQLFAVLF